jgi:hypothetical protein
LAPGTCLIGPAIVSGSNRVKRISTHDDWSKNLLQVMPVARRMP